MSVRNRRKSSIAMSLRKMSDKLIQISAHADGFLSPSDLIMMQSMAEAMEQWAIELRYGTEGSGE